MISITYNECLILHHKAFRTDYNSCSTKIGAPMSEHCTNSSTARILIQVRY